MPNIYNKFFTIYFPSVIIFHHFTRVAILLLKEGQYSGPLQLKQRHLEMMGYKIVPVNKTIWSSMFMAEPKAKISFLEEKLFGNVEQIENINK